ncbi:hypothetical protein F503_03555 [Ophiostoma piceae UAMH 11346]|uniref:Glycoside hydrolase family 92 protein n=1 Tax=Ophiostoma piceae (strain UAMH 11346) TaxID=1262450 RepID=S3CDT6_OPHP1|nr:hypothetical protein F503_03555 [Ophiostoma piceae UAMH 11346]
MHITTLALLVPLVTAAQFLNTSSDPFSYIDPLIGTVNGGHVFPGATLPFGMAKAVADVNTENQGGFASDNGDITGFSHMHDSGTGGGSSLGNFPLFPQAGCPGDDVNNCHFTERDRATKRINGTVVASPGYFALTLNTLIRAETTVSNHTALYRFIFPDTINGETSNPLILLDLKDLPGSRTNASISVDASTGRMVGNGTFSPSFGIGTYDLHFCADFMSGLKLKDTGVFMNNRAGSEPKNLRTYADGIDSPAVPAGAWVQYNGDESPPEVIVRVGVSFMSSAQACANAEHEIPSFDFNATHEAAEDAWRAKLAPVQIDHTGVNTTLRKVFWSGLYRTMLSPQDYTGENPLWESEEPYYDSFYCIWDSYRSIHPLITLVDPKSQARMVRSLIDTYRHEGWLPDCRMSLCKGYTQGGSNADVVLSDSFVKGLDEDIDWKTGYEAVVKDAEVEPPIWSVEGRGGLASWTKYGYIPVDDFDTAGVGPFTRSISRTVEYAYNDFCISAMATKLGHEDDATKYRQRSGNWANLWQADRTSVIPMNTTDPATGAVVQGQKNTGFTGFLQPRYLNGTFGSQDPLLCQPLLDFTACYLNSNGHETYEGGSWLYSFYAPHDMAALIVRMGGAESFVARLQYAHDTPNLLYIGDEQAFLLVYLFHYAGRPALSSHYAHKYIPSQFNDTLAGIPGNDDSGAMGAFSTLAMMGLWPMSGQNVYLITPPFFREVNITSGITGRTATVRNANFDATYSTSIYIQHATLNGKPYTRNWIDHSFFTEGGVLELTLGLKESTWGTADADLPPSLSTTESS